MSDPTLGVLLPFESASVGAREQTEPFDTAAVAGQSANLRDADWWAVVDPGARLDPAFAAVVRDRLRAEPSGGALYSDFTVAGRVIRVGGWSVERARWQDYTGPVAVIHRGVLRSVPPDQPLRVAALRGAGGVQYAAQPLYRAAHDEIPELPAQRRRVLGPPDLPYEVTGTARRPGRRLLRPRSVSVVIPTRGSTGDVRGRRIRLVDNCLTGLLPVLGGEDLDLDVVLVVDTDVDGSYVDPWAARLGDRLTVVGTDPPFNFSTKINAGVAAARGEFVCLLNDDIEPITPDWLAEMVALAAEPGVGAVGALLLYEDGTVQHAGHVMGGNGVHLVDAGRRPEDGPRRRNLCDRDVSGVSAACLVQRKQVWANVGGLDPEFPVSFNDVDYSERIRGAGMRVVQCNAARLHHYESRTRVAGATPQEVRLLRSRWGAAMLGPDPLTVWESGDEPVVRFPVVRYRLRRIRAEYRAGGSRAVLAAASASIRERWGGG